MSEPYTPGMIARILRVMSEPQLAATSPQQFQLWPVRHIVPSSIVSEMIRNERANRSLAR